MLQSTLISSIIKGRVYDEIPTNYTLTKFLLETNGPNIKERNLNGDAFIDAESGCKVTHQQFRDQISQVVSGLINKHKLRRGDVIALLTSNHVNFPGVVFAALSVGIIITTLNPNHSDKEVAYQMEHSNTKLVIAAPELFDLDKKARYILNSDLSIVSIEKTNDNNSFEHLLCDESYDELIFKEGECQETVAVIMYTSGTTGIPKGIAITHYNFIANIIQVESFQTEGDSETKYLLGVSPIYYIYAFMYPILQGIHRHLTIILMKQIDFSLLLKTIERYKLNFLTLTPPVLLLLAKQPTVDEFDLTSLKKIMCGGSHLPYDVASAVSKRLECKVQQVYGMSETVFLTMADKDSTPLDVAGKLMPNMLAKIIDPDTREVLNIGEKGELWLKGPKTMKGYLKNEKANKNVFDMDGFMSTGDIAFFDKDHYLHIFDRVNELIKYKGHMISPARLEEALLTHSDVKDCCAIGAINENNEELPRAFIVLTESDESDQIRLEKIKVQVHKLLAPYEYFRGGLVKVNFIPKSPAGKILRRMVRDQENRKREIS